MASRLEERFREALAERTINIDDDSLSFAVELARLAVRALSLTDPTPAERKALVAAVNTRTGLEEKLGQQLVRLTLAPEFRANLSEHDLRSFAAHFGEGSGAALRSAAGDELDLGAFAHRHGSSEALLLLDTLFAIAAAERGINPTEISRLQQAAQDLNVDGVLFTALLQKHDGRHATGDLFFPLNQDRLVIGRASGCDVCLPDPQVAVRHAELMRDGDGWRVVDLGSGRPTVVGGAAVTSSPLAPGAKLRIGPYTLTVVDDRLQVFGERSFSALSVRGVSRTIGGVSLLDDVSFTVFTGEVVALVGPSGAGKTTLLNAINGIAPADSGEVLFDSHSFHGLLALDRSLVGVVPQDDLVSPELTVEESLSYSGRLRFSPDVTDAEVQTEVDRVLSELDIEHIRKSRIGDALRRGISGGQRKRVNLGQELLTRSTRVLFLDEPTSGLDPRASQDIVRLVRQLADRGRIVFLVTHDLTPEVMAQVDHLLVLAKGGRLAFFGPPAEACRSFGVSTPDAIFNRFSDHEPAEWGRRYREGPAARKYVATREHLIGLAGVSRSKAVEGGGVSLDRGELLERGPGAAQVEADAGEQSRGGQGGDVGLGHRAGGGLVGGRLPAAGEQQGHRAGQEGEGSPGQQASGCGAQGAHHGRLSSQSRMGVTSMQASPTTSPVGSVTVPQPSHSPCISKPSLTSTTSKVTVHQRPAASRTEMAPVGSSAQG